MSSDALKEAYRLIRAGQQQQAVRILVPIVRDEPLNADAWWLLANAVENNDQKERALRTVLKLRPNDAPARRMLDRLTPPEPSPVVDDLPSDDFNFDLNADFDADDPFGDAPAKRKRAPGRRSSSPITIILALIGLLTVISCVACLGVTVLGGTAITTVFTQIMQTVTFEPSFGTLTHLSASAAATAAAPQLMPSDLQKRGSISVGDTKQAVVDTFHDDSWTFSADANEHVVIELTANDAVLDPHLYLYDPSGQWVADNDDIDGANNRNSRLDLTLAKAGLYTIRVSSFNSGGAYSLSLREG